nr:MAG TPA: hypothetical protein [Caudoviricetes sp.]
MYKILNVDNVIAILLYKIKRDRQHSLSLNSNPYSFGPW